MPSKPTPKWPSIAQRRNVCCDALVLPSAIREMAIAKLSRICSDELEDALFQGRLNHTGTQYAVKAT